MDHALHSAQPRSIRAHDFDSASWLPKKPWEKVIPVVNRKRGASRSSSQQQHQQKIVHETTLFFLTMSKTNDGGTGDAGKSNQQHIHHLSNPFFSSTLLPSPDYHSFSPFHANQKCSPWGAAAREKIYREVSEWANNSIEFRSQLSCLPGVRFVAAYVKNIRMVVVHSHALHWTHTHASSVKSWSVAAAESTRKVCDITKVDSNWAFFLVEI